MSKLPPHLQRRFQQPVEAAPVNNAAYPEQNTGYPNNNQFQQGNPQQTPQPVATPNYNMNNDLQNTQPRQYDQTQQRYDQPTQPQGGYNPPPNYNTPAPQNQPRNPQPQGLNKTNRASSSEKGKIDPEQIPRPLCSMTDSIKPKKFISTRDGNPPYPSHLIYEVKDEGCAGPRHMRSTLYSIGNEPKQLEETHVPLGIVSQPLAEMVGNEEGVLLVDYGDAGPFRCVRCKGYVNPFFVFTEGGNSAQCNLCKMINKVPQHYYCPLDEKAQRRDRLEKPELSKGIYEFMAPRDYHTREVVKPSLVFLIEVTPVSYSLGVFAQVLSSLQVILDYLPNPEITDIGIITYGHGLQLVLPPSDLANDPIIVCLPESDEPDMPYPAEKVMFNLTKDREKLDYVIQKTTEYFDRFFAERQAQKTPGAHTAAFAPPSLGAALMAGQALLSKRGGKILTFATTLPLSGAGKLKNRNDMSIYNTDKEKTLFEQQSPFYSDLAYKLLSQRIGVDLFIFSSEYYDVVTVSPVATITGGSVYLYPSYNSISDGEKLHYEISRILTRYQGFDIIMKMRTSQGINVQETLTSGFKRPVAEFEFSCFDADKSMTFFIKQDDKIQDSEAYLQLAILYTNPSGERVLRIINMALKVTNDISQIFRSADTETIAFVLIRRGLATLSATPVKTIREQLQAALVGILYSYRIHCATSSARSQLILPESLKYLPLYIFSAFNKPGLRLKPITNPDHRWYDFIRSCDRSLVFYLTYLYPRIYPLHTIYANETGLFAGDNVDERIALPTTIPDRQEKLDPDGIYLVDNSEYLHLLVFKDVDPSLLSQIFGVQTIDELATNVVGLPQIPESDLNNRVNLIVDQIRRNKNTVYQSVKLEILQARTPNAILANMLVEDEFADGSDYADFLCTVHGLIQKKYT